MAKKVSKLARYRKLDFTVAEVFVALSIVAIILVLVVPKVKGNSQASVEETAIENCSTVVAASEEALDTATNSMEYEIAMEEQLGEGADLAVSEADATGSGYAKGSWKGGNLEITFIISVGTNSVSWTDAEGNTAVWEAGDEAPVLQ